MTNQCCDIFFLLCKYSYFIYIHSDLWIQRGFVY